MQSRDRARPGITTAAKLSRFLLTVAGAAAACLLLLPLPPAQAQVNVYVLGSGNAVADTTLVNTLTGFGHNVTLGVEYTAFNGTQSLAGINTVYLQTNYNWPNGDMPAAGQTALVNFVNGGGGVVTTEWLLWKNASSGNTQFSILNPILPATPTSAFDGDLLVTFAQVTPDAILNAGLPTSFDVTLESIGGTRTDVSSTRPGATVYYSNDGGFLSVIGGPSGAGRVLNFSTVNGQAQVQDPDFARLLSNSMNWAAGISVSAATPEPATAALLAFTLLPLTGAAVARRRLRQTR
jgi:hypothetical protein